MKSAIIILLMLFACSNIMGQQVIRKQTICLISEIPLLIESDPIIYAFDQKEIFTIGTGRIKIWNIGTQQPVEFDHLLQIRKPFPIDLKKDLVSKLYLDNKILSQNKITKPNERDLLIDTILKETQILELRWFNKSNKLSQSIVFKCLPIIPTIIGIRFPKSLDSIDQTHKARQIKRINVLPEGFTQIKGNTISMKAGTNLELKLKIFGLLTDSSVQYRITNSKDQLPAIWQTSGHVLTLPNLPSDNIYKLELRYQGQPAINSYQINIAPYWHQLLWVRVSAIVLLITVVIIITRWYYRRNIRLINAQRQRLEEQLTTIQSQLNPHFIFNALSSIEGLVSGGQNKLANEYLTNFSLIMRETLKNADKLLISLKEEIALLEKYISIEELRFGFNCTISMDPQINPDAIQVPPMLAQPLIENGVKHGAASNGKLDLSITKEDNNMLIRVINGKAESKSQVQTAGGYGLTFTKQRLEHFSKLHPQTPIEFDFVERESSYEAILRFVNWFA